jgi:hypothetical protein
LLFALALLFARISGPETASKFLSSDHLSGVFEKRDEHPAGLLLQLDVRLPFFSSSPEATFTSNGPN